VTHAEQLEQVTKQIANKHGLSHELVLAIADLESSGGTNARLRKNKNGTYDVGPFQINSVHWNTTCKNLDVSSLQGNATCAARLLVHARRHSKSDAAWIGRYHSKTPSRKVWYNDKVQNILKRRQSRD